jgi:membrane protein YdbS with pleckstrin-like domain
MPDVAIQHPKRHKHKKRVLRFIIFFLFLIVFSVIEDLLAFYLHGTEFDVAIFLIVIVIATIFTAIAEISEFIFKKEEPKIEKFVQKEEKVIKKEERKIESGMQKLKKI